MCTVNAIQEQDISLESLVQMVILNDEEVLTCRTLWSDQVMTLTKNACTGGLDFGAIFLELRKEALRRGLCPEAKVL